MKLIEALDIANTPANPLGPREYVYLLCGFAPLHLKTFLMAHLRLCSPEGLIEIKTGFFGDLAGNLERLKPTRGAHVCILVEWADLDPRLGIRSLGSWDSEDVPDIIESASRQSLRLAHLIKQASEEMPVYVSAPTLPLPPIFPTSTVQARSDECKLREIAASFALSISANHGTKVINPQRLDEISPPSRRFNAKEELASGFPYQLEHASILAEVFSRLIKVLQPKKGIITDLDETMWKGILGDIGVEDISWDLATRAHLHGLYQRFLSSLTSSGVLLAVASKNERSLVERVLERPDMLLGKERLFPLEINWDAKSESIERILRVWNIGPEDVIFIDDSPLEVAEVQSAYPQMECILFPKSSPSAFWDLLRHLRDRFGKNQISPEDSIRLGSIRNGELFRKLEGVSGSHSDDFLRAADAQITFSCKPDPRDDRAFELLNKTNQFNLNGRRLDDAEWATALDIPGAFLLTATYEDKYGTLGKIAVVLGKSKGSTLHVSSWVMSCRAFSRRIEYTCLKYLFERTSAATIVFDYAFTPRNEPLRIFLQNLIGEDLKSNLSISKDTFLAKAPTTYQRIIEAQNN
jgi:FkbH-like protein